MSESESVCLRRKGNAEYTAATEDLGPSERKSKLCMSLSWYEKALQLSTKQTEKASASKNIGMASWKIAKILVDQGEATQTRHFYFKEAISNINSAYVFGNCYSQMWTDALLQSMYGCIQDALSSFDTYVRFENQIHFILKYVDLIAVDYLQAECYVEVANLRFKRGLFALQKGDCRDCLKQMKECHFPIEEARMLGKRQDHILKEIETLEKDTYIHTCMAESIQARQTGDNLLDTVMKEQEDLNIDMVWEIVDWYKQAALLTRETDMELEAIALSRLGKVYDKVFQMKSKAQQNLKRSIQLAMSLQPRTFHSEDWFQYATETIERYQKQVVEQENDKWRKDREEAMKELKSDVAALEEVRNDSVELLQYVYKNYPPKDGRHKLGKIPDQSDSDYKNKLKKLLQKAVTHYHPDRCNMEKHGKKWKVLCEEITKLITNKYEGYK